MDCTGPRNVHTLGHSTRTFDSFIALLKAHSICQLVDVRRWPTSKRFPHFRREALARALASEGVDYTWRGDLGGYRKPAVDSPNLAWETATFRAYADFMLTDEFARIMSEVEIVAADKTAAIMCAEALPWRCHRQLIADAFLVRGWRVLHILESGCKEHRLPPFARPTGTKVLYPALF